MSMQTTLKPSTHHLIAFLLDGWPVFFLFGTDEVWVPHSPHPSNNIELLGTPLSRGVREGGIR